MVAISTPSIDHHEKDWPASAAFLTGIFFNPEEVDKMFLSNFRLSLNYTVSTVSQPRRLHSPSDSLLAPDGLPSR
jgi:hypothetical protein